MKKERQGGGVSSAAATRLPALNHRQCITSLQNCKSPGIAITALWGPYILKSKCQRWKSKKKLPGPDGPGSFQL